MNYLLRIVLPGLLLFSANASAIEFNQVSLKDSTVKFYYQQMGVPLDGKFNKFSAQISFDPAKIAQAKARIDMDIASIDTGSEEGNDAVVGKLWFNAKAFPAASFVSTGLKALGGNRYQASGKLSIKGHTHDVVAPVTFQGSGTQGAFDGEFDIQRLDYAIGEGEWTDLGTVANAIKIKFHIVVHAVPGKK